MGVYGLGHDVVDVAGFSEQLDVPGSRMRALFSVREVRQAIARAASKHDGEAVHLAARWAGKEAVLKAWCEAVGNRPLPYSIETFPWTGVEILDDAHGRPHVVLRDDVDRELHASLPPSGGGVMSRMPASRAGVEPVPPSSVALRWHVSLTHDGPVASAVVILESA